LRKALQYAKQKVSFLSGTCGGSFIIFCVYQKLKIVLMLILQTLYAIRSAMEQANRHPLLIFFITLLLRQDFHGFRNF